MWQNVFNEVLLAWFKFQANTPSLFGVSVLTDIGHSMSRNLILGVSSVTVSHLINYDNLLQNVTDIITKYGIYF